MSEIIYVLDTPGAGGSSTIFLSAEGIPPEKYQVANVGERIAAAVSESVERGVKGLTQRDYISKGVERTIEAVYNSQSNRRDILTIIDSYPLIRTTDCAYIPCTWKQFVFKLPPSRVVFIRAQPEELYERLRGDPRRREYGVEELREYQEENLKAASALCYETGVPLSIIWNHTGEQLAAANLLRSILFPQAAPLKPVARYGMQRNREQMDAVVQRAQSVMRSKDVSSLLAASPEEQEKLIRKLISLEGRGKAERRR